MVALIAKNLRPAHYTELHFLCATEAICSRYEIRTRVGRMKICNPDQLDEPTEQREPSSLVEWLSREEGRAMLNRPSWGV